MSDPKRDAEIALAKAQQDEDLKTVLSTPAGRRFVWRLLEKATNLYGKSYSGEPLSSAYNEGRRSVGIDLAAEVKRVAKGSYVDMLLEELEARRPRVVEPEQEQA